MSSPKVRKRAVQLSQLGEVPACVSKKPRLHGQFGGGAGSGVQDLTGEPSSNSMFAKHAQNTLPKEVK